MESIYYTRSTIAEDYFDFYNNYDAINVIKMPDGKLVSPDNELLAHKTLILDNFYIHEPLDEIHMEDTDKYFIEIVWYDDEQSSWYSAILVPSTWNDVLIGQSMCEGKVYMSENKPTTVIKMKELYSLSFYKETRAIRQNITNVKASLEHHAHHVYVTRGMYSGIFKSRKYENIVHKSELDKATFIWISGWKLQKI